MDNGRQWTAGEDTEARLEYVRYIRQAEDWVACWQAKACGTYSKL